MNQPSLERKPTRSARLRPMIVALALLSTPAWATQQVNGPRASEAGDSNLEPLPSIDGDPEQNGCFAGVMDAIQEGRTWVNFRYRFENVDQDGFSRDAHASTLRTRVGFESGTYRGFSGLVEFEDVTAAGNGNLFNSTTNGHTDRPTVADPSSTEVNQVYLKYKDSENREFRVGRQRIILGNARFIGNVGWRQNEQTFDSGSASLALPGEVDFYYAFLENANRVFSDDSPAGDHRMMSHIINLHRNFEGVGDLTAYAYLLDYDRVDAFSTNTVGARLAGRRDISDVGVLYEAEYAHQVDSGDNPTDVDAGYMHGAIGAVIKSVTVKVGAEVLEGSSGVGDKFTTPLATLHAWNGWADKFLATPDTGIEDWYVSIQTMVKKAKVQVVYHMFEAESGSMDYGEEIDAIVSLPISKHLKGGIKYANYDSDGNAAFPGDADTQKFWVWLELNPFAGS